MALRRPTGLILGGTLLVGVLALEPVRAGGASGDVCEAVVVDDGPNTGQANWSPVGVQAATVAPGSSDLDALAAGGESATANSAGLICAIDNYPPNGLQNCLATSGSEYFYWSYWQGDPSTNTWTYGEVGPASHTVGSGQTYVQGWRFQNPGPDNPTATKPSVTPAAAFAQACPGVAPVPVSGAGSGAGGGGSGSSAAAVNPAPTSTTTSPTSATRPPPTPTPTTAPAGARTGGAAATTTTPTRAAPGTGAPRREPGAPTTSTTSAGQRGPTPVTARSALAVRPGTTGGGDPAFPVVVVAVIIAALGGVAWWRWRRRPVEE